MTKEQLIEKCCIRIEWENNTARVECLIDSALAFINSYTFQNYSFENGDIDNIPKDIFPCIIEMVYNKRNQKSGIQSERLSDYSITYTNEDINQKIEKLLNKYVIYYVV
jgi:hypothetical protein